MSTQPDIQSTLSTRGSTHGDFELNTVFMQELKSLCRSKKGWYELDPYQREAIEMICHKLGRIIYGNSNFPDHWHDIAGYATLVENILTTGNSHPTIPK